VRFIHHLVLPLQNNDGAADSLISAALCHAIKRHPSSGVLDWPPIILQGLLIHLISADQSARTVVQLIPLFASLTAAQKI
jgi:hypothetical protein